jgi:predicted double-glycine peptidase
MGLKPETQVASTGAPRVGLNKFNAPEVLGMLFKALEAAELTDTIEELRKMGVPRIVNDAWMSRARMAASKKGSSRENWNWKPWATHIADWLELQLGMRPQAMFKAYPSSYKVSFLFPSGGETSAQASNKWDSGKLDAAWKNFVPTWTDFGVHPVSPRVTRFSSSFELDDGTEVEFGIGWGSASGMTRIAQAPVTPIRQRTQYSCMATSMTMCLKAHGMNTNEDAVNEVMGAVPMRGASWENALACAQHFGFRATLVVPATLKQIKAWTDVGTPVMIAWNPEGRDWSHASVVFDVDDEFNVSVADPNIPDPDQTVRVVTKDEFYHKWFEKWPNYLVRRPAMAVEREITPEGRQMLASRPGPHWNPYPQQPSELAGEIEALEFLLKNPRHLQPMLDQPEKPGDRQKTMVAVKALIDALKTENRAAARRSAQSVPDSYAQLVSNTVWNFIQTGRTFLAVSKVNLRDPVFKSAVERAVSLLSFRDEKTVARMLMKDNMLSAGDAFQAVKAAGIIFKDRAERTNRRGAVEHMGKAKTKPVDPPKKDKNKIVVEAPEERNPVEHQRIQDRAKGTGGAGAHKNRTKDVERGKAPEKHKKDLRDKEAAVRVASRWLEGKDIEDV